MRYKVLVNNRLDPYSENTWGSMWVPYEYGRVKKPVPRSLQVLHWRHPNLVEEMKKQNQDFPEYFVLGATLINEQKIRSWLQTEMVIWRQAHRLCLQGTDEVWQGDVPDPLPGEEIKPPDEFFSGKSGRQLSIVHEENVIWIGDVPLPLR